MKLAIASLVVFCLGVGVGTLLQMEKAPLAEAGQEPKCAPLLVTGDGEVIQDMNGDGVLDPIAEALRLLSWAFLGGPAPVPPCAGGGPVSLPDTGQTKCYTESEEVTCGDPVFNACVPRQDGRYSTGCPNDANRFVDHGDGTVTDNCTGLMWQKNTADTNGDGQLTVADPAMWCDALAYCENVTFAGHEDWRLPNVRELQSIVDYGRCDTGMDGPAIDPVFGAIGERYWTSSSVVPAPHFAWCVCAGLGEVDIGEKVFRSHVRAVRNAP